MQTNIDDVINNRHPRNGDYSETARVSQNIKAMFHDSPNWLKLPAYQIEALEMIANKLARILNGDSDYPDHWLDVEGYARLVYTRLVGEYAPLETKGEPSAPPLIPPTPPARTPLRMRNQLNSKIEEALADIDRGE